MLEQTIAGLGKELKRMEKTSDEQIALAAQNLSNQYEKAMSAMTNIMASTSTDFSATAQDMHAAAKQVMAEIDDLRGQMRQSIIDMPDEARANADAMRKVVADQITALSALADVVRRHGDRVDLSGPGIRPADNAG